MSTPEPPPPPDPDTPQVLLFGHAGAGKSALLGALLRAGQIQAAALHGEVLDPSGRLAPIRDAVYNGADLPPTDAVLASYTVRLRPSGEKSKAAAEPETVVLNDCSGQAAEALIRKPASLRDAKAQSPLTRAVIEADAIMLLVDATSDDEELREAFEEFDAFLTAVAQTKASAREVGGFPILLVLTKCDELAKRGDTRAKWEARVHDRAERAWAKFDAFLKDANPEDDIPSPFLPFGSIDLSVYAVAVRLPKLPETHGEADTPFGVAELFRDAFTASRSHRERVTVSNRQLKWTVRAAITLVLFMFLGVLSVTLFPPPRTDVGLAEQVTGYLLHEPEPAVRLAEPEITLRKRILTAFRTDPGFVAISEDLQAFVIGRLKEIEDYQAYRDRLLAATAPGDVRTLEDLDRVEQTLQGELALPAQYGWGDTEAARLRQKWLADVQAIRQAEEKFLRRYEDFVRRGTVLTLSPTLGGNWRPDVNALVAEAAEPNPAALAQPLPGSPAVELPRGQPVTERAPFEFERVYNARRDWEATRNRLLHLRDLADALGLTAGLDRPEPVLVLPEPGPGVNTETLAGARWTALLRTFDRESDDYREWEIRNFPDPGRSVLAGRLDDSFRTGVRHVQGLIRSRLGPDLAEKDTPKTWRALANVLGDPASPFPEWGRLLHLLARLRDPAAPNPVRELYTFLLQPKFELDLPGFDLVIPIDLALERVSPSGPLTITLTPKGGTPVTRRFEQSGGGTREGSVTRYHLKADEKEKGKLTYQPGDELRAELPLRAGNQDYKLVWENGNSRTYQFDKLTREPRLVKPGGTSEPATGVRLTPTPGSVLPRLPVLFPDLKR